MWYYLCGSRILPSFACCYTTFNYEACNQAPSPIAFHTSFKFVLFVLSHTEPRKVSCMAYVKFSSYHMRRKPMLTTTLFGHLRIKC